MNPIKPPVRSFGTWDNVCPKRKGKRFGLSPLNVADATFVVKLQCLLFPLGAKFGSTSGLRKGRFETGRGGRDATCGAKMVADDLVQFDLVNLVSTNCPVHRQSQVKVTLDTLI